MLTPTIIESVTANYQYSLPAGLVVVRQSDDGDFDAVDTFRDSYFGKVSNFGVFRAKWIWSTVTGTSIRDLMEQKINLFLSLVATNNSLSAFPLLL